MSKHKKVSVAVGSAIVVTMAVAVGYCVIKKMYDWRNLKLDMTDIPWDFEGKEVYR